MNPIFNQHLDYLYFLNGFAFLFLGAIILVLARREARQDRFPWIWLAIFGLLHGVGEWLEMAAPSLPDQAFLHTVRLAVLALSFFLLLEFSRRGFCFLKGRRIPAALTVLLLLSSGWGFFCDPEAMTVSLRYTLGITGLCAAAYVIWLFRQRHPHRSPSLPVAAGAFLLYGMTAGIVVPEATFFPASQINETAFADLTGLPVQALRAILALGIALSFYFHIFFHQPAGGDADKPRKMNYRRLTAILSLLFMLAAGWAATDYSGKRKTLQLKNDLILHVHLAAVSLDPALIRQLSWSEADLTNPVYAYLKEKMIRLHQATPHSRFVCLMGYRDQASYVLADSEPPGSPDYSPPGQYYEEASAAYLQLLSGDRHDIIGPLHDRWGSWITGVSPVVQFEGKNVHLVFDFDAGFWAQEIGRARLMPIAIVLLLTVIVLIFLVLYQESLDARQALAASEATLRRVFDHVHDAVIVHDHEGHILYANSRTLDLYGIEPHDVPFLSVIGDLSAAGNDLAMVRNAWSGVLAGENALFEWRARRPHDESEFPVEVHLSRMDLSGKSVIVATIRDLTAHKRAEEENSALQEQLLQAQKMESVGRLAGGVAHDFNNMLAAILGYAELTLEYMTPPGSPHRESLLEIQKAGERAKSLTRQLLAFGRKQMLAFKVTSLNGIIVDFEKLVRRLIGEDIQIRKNLAPDLQPIMADVSQMEQILMNLAVNARDAMPDGGNLLIETANVRLTEEDSRLHPGLVPGDYARLTFTDTGCGMDEETRKKIFDPFFTTKEQGKGTGLGLATVYGIVSQHGGHIEVSSRRGQGTSFVLYFPASDLEKQEETSSTGTPPEDIAVRPLRVLVVEDDPAVRILACRFLDQMGHKVMESRDTRDAIRISSEQRAGIDLMLTDVIMPEMTGRELYEQVREFSPAMHVVYMSGYPEEIIAHHGVLDPDTLFLQKPFSYIDLSRTIQAAFSRT